MTFRVVWEPELNERQREMVERCRERDPDFDSHLRLVDWLGVMQASWEIATMFMGPDDGLSDERDDIECQIAILLSASFEGTATWTLCDEKLDAVRQLVADFNKGREDETSCQS